MTVWPISEADTPSCQSLSFLAEARTFDLGFSSKPKPQATVRAFFAMDVDAGLNQLNQLTLEQIVVNRLFPCNVKLKLLTSPPRISSWRHGTYPESADQLTSMRNRCSDCLDCLQITLGDFAQFFLLSYSGNRIQ